MVWHFFLVFLTDIYHTEVLGKKTLRTFLFIVLVHCTFHEEITHFCAVVYVGRYSRCILFCFKYTHKQEIGFRENSGWFFFFSITCDVWWINKMPSEFETNFLNFSQYPIYWHKYKINVENAKRKKTKDNQMRFLFDVRQVIYAQALDYILSMNFSVFQECRKHY